MADMKTLINDFAQHIDEGVEISKSMKYKQPDREIRNVVICGMGGSGIGGKLVSLWIQGDIKVPVTLVQEYELPHFVDAHTLIIASSYSGNTEETLIAFAALGDAWGHHNGLIGFRRKKLQWLLEQWSSFSWRRYVTEQRGRGLAEILLERPGCRRGPYWERLLRRRHCMCHAQRRGAERRHPG